MSTKEMNRLEQKDSAFPTVAGSTGSAVSDDDDNAKENELKRKVDVIEKMYKAECAKMKALLPSMEFVKQAQQEFRADVNNNRAFMNYIAALNIQDILNRNKAMMKEETQMSDEENVFEEFDDNDLASTDDEERNAPPPPSRKRKRCNTI